KAGAVSLFPAATRGRPRSAPEHAGAGPPPQTETAEAASAGPPALPGAGHARRSPRWDDEHDERAVPRRGGPVPGRARLAAFPGVSAADRRRHAQESGG